MTNSEEPLYQDLLESTAAEILMPPIFVEQRPSAAAPKAASADDNMNRMLQEQDLIRLLQQQNAPLQPFASVSIASMLGDTLQTKKRESNVALHNRAANSIFSAPGEATNTSSIDKEPAASGTGGILCVPCRARGMPKGHVFKIAHLQIPDSIKHGDELLCTYPACRASGVKFCYCSYCRVPVAKRNFRVRHHHFGEAEAAATPLFASTSASVASPAPPASSFVGPSTNATSNDLDLSTLQGLLSAGSGTRNLSLVGMATPSLYSAHCPSGTIDSILQEIGLQALQQSVSMSSAPQSQLDIDILSLLGATNNTSLLSSLSSAPPRQLLSHSVASLHSLPPLSAYAMSGSNDDGLPKDNKIPKPLMTFPCQARGMPADHKRTAYFVIPGNAKHGESLTCSHKKCRDLGVKFYFCAYCNIPVAKRCFRMRHHHSEDGAAGAATITNSLDKDSSSGTLSSSYSPNSSQAFKVPLSSGGRADSSNSTLRSNISALAASTPVSRPSKKREQASSFDHGSDHHAAKMSK